MKFFSNLVIALGVLLGSGAVAAEQAALTASTERLSPAGGAVTLTATSVYEGQPAALGWEIELPAGWSLVSVSGANLPGVAPEPGATGTLEFAFIAVPPGGASFSATVRYPPQTAHGTLHSVVVLRANNKATTLRPEPVVFSRAVPPARHRPER